MIHHRVTILHKDDDFLVINKPGGLLSVPGRGPDKQDCVVNRIRKLYPDTIEQPAVHRLDMQTSGIMVLARNKQSHRQLSKQFENRKTEKEYIALLQGKVDASKGRIELKFRLDPDNRPYQIYDADQGKLGISLWWKLSDEGECTRIKFIPITGRTHQLRLHAAHHLGLNAPIVGDSLYGDGVEGTPMKLHAARLSFFHPSTGNRCSFTSQVPF